MNEQRQEQAAAYVLGALPEDERRALRARWRSLSPEQRRAWLEAGGPGIVPQPADAGGGRAD